MFKLNRNNLSKRYERNVQVQILQRNTPPLYTICYLQHQQNKHKCSNNLVWLADIKCNQSMNNKQSINSTDTTQSLSDHNSNHCSILQKIIQSYFHINRQTEHHTTIPTNLSPNTQLYKKNLKQTKVLAQQNKTKQNKKNIFFFK
jgi:hypothetical protein